MALDRWWLTDLAVTKDPVAAPELNQNLRQLNRLGANMCRDETGSLSPHARVSGFPLSDPPADCEIGLLSPGQLINGSDVPGARVLHLVWGSPHRCTSDHLATSQHAPGSRNNSDFKTKAFEAMAWQTSRCQGKFGLVAMTFPAVYHDIEFWPRRPGDNRILHVSPVRFHRHRSRCSGTCRGVRRRSLCSYVAFFLVIRQSTLLPTLLLLPSSSPSSPPCSSWSDRFYVGED